MKLEANMDAVILRQSVQLQIKVSTRPGPWVGWELGDEVRAKETNGLGGKGGKE